MELSDFADYLKPRAPDWHKGLSGHVLVVGGELGFSGAPRMAGEAALCAGAGLVTIATREENAIVMNVNRPELMCHGVSTPFDLKPLLARADVVIVGPGLGQNDWSKALWTQVCGSGLPLVMDADALNLLAESPFYFENWVLTPHPGEAARLLKTTATLVQDDRVAVANEINKRFGGVCVLKGAGTLIAAPNAPLAKCDKGNPGMATAGTGDVLSGVIGSLIAQGLPLDVAARMGVCVHAMAGDLAAEEGGEKGMLAMDLMPHIRQLVNR